MHALVPVIKKTVRLREEPNGGLLIDDAEENFGRYLLTSPFEAFILSLFDGSRDIEEISIILKVLKNSPDEKLIQEDIKKFIHQREEFVEIIDSPLGKPRKQIDPIKFLSKPDLLSKPIRSSKPIWVDFYVTRMCNLKCIYCFADANHPNNDFGHDDFKFKRKRIYNLIDQIAGLEIKRVLVTGGEPALLPYLPDIIDRFVKNHIQVVLATNACLVGEKMAEELKAAGLQKVQVKLDASSPKIQDKLSGVEGSFEELIKGIKALKKKNFHLSVASVVTSINIKEIPKTIAICADLGVDEFSPRLYSPGIWALYGRGGAELIPSSESIFWLKQEITDLQEKYKAVMKISSFDFSLFNKKNENEVPRCPGFISSCAVLDNGLVVPCETLSDFSPEFIIGDTNNETLIDIWNSERAVNWVLRKSPKIEGPCTTCDEFDRCQGGCPWTSYLAYGKWSADPSCVRAPRPTHMPLPKISST